MNAFKVTNIRRAERVSRYDYQSNMRFQERLVEMKDQTGERTQKMYVPEMYASLLIPQMPVWEFSCEHGPVGFVFDDILLLERSYYDIKHAEWLWRGIPGMCECSLDSMMFASMVSIMLLRHGKMPTRFAAHNMYMLANVQWGR